MNKSSLNIDSSQKRIFTFRKPRIVEKALRNILSPTSLQFFADFLFITISYLIHYYIRFESGLFDSIVNPDLSAIITTLVVLLFYWIMIFGFSGLYKNWYIRSPFDELFMVIKAGFAGCFILFFFIFLDGAHHPRLLFLLYFALLTLSVSFGRLVARNIQKRLRARRIVTIPAIIIGNLEKSKALYKKTIKAPAWGYRVLGIITLSDSEAEQDTEVDILGNFSSFKQIVDKLNIKEVLITADSPDRATLLDITSYCAFKNILVKIEPDMYDIFSGQARTLPIYGIPLIEISTQLLKPWQAALKRFSDILISTLVIVAGLPVWLLLVLIIKLESRGKVFYTQERVGKDGYRFYMTKFRSMVQNAEKHGPQWAEVNDPRVTKFGKFLRKSHLDEIPQFWNVLKGEMSIVGPRPERPVFVEKFNNIISYYNRRHVVRPGITGWWQVNYTVYVESKEEIENRLKDDFYYIENISLKLDFEIMVRTVFCILKGHGQA